MPEEQPEARSHRIRTTLRSNPLALALGVLAVIIASTGTAVAVTLAKTTIVDPKVPSRAVRVDSSGRLSVTGPVTVSGPVRVTPPTATISRSVYASTPSTGELTRITQPTTATVAVTRFTVGNPSLNKTASNASYTVTLVQVTADADGACSGSGDRITLARFDVDPGDYRYGEFATPLLVAPIAGKKYCLGAYGYTTNRGSDTGGYFAYVNFGAYAVRGTVKPVAAVGRVANSPRKTVR